MKKFVALALVLVLALVSITVLAEPTAGSDDTQYMDVTLNLGAYFEWEVQSALTLSETEEKTFEIKLDVWNHMPEYDLEVAYSEEQKLYLGGEEGKASVSVTLEGNTGESRTLLTDLDDVSSDDVKTSFDHDAIRKLPEGEYKGTWNFTAEVVKAK